MKIQFRAFVAILFVLPALASDRPTCSNGIMGGSFWTLGKERVESKSRCDELEVECINQGTRSEQWVFVKRRNERALQFMTCSGPSAEKPICVGDGTRSEGWQFPNGRLVYANCSEETVDCLYVGSRHEQWATFQKEQAGIAFYANCAD